MFSDQDFVVTAKVILMGVIGLLLILKWVHYWIFKSKHPKESVRFRFITPYPERERYATGSSSKRIFMTNNNRVLYLTLILTGIVLMLLVIPQLA